MGSGFAFTIPRRSVRKSRPCDFQICYVCREDIAYVNANRINAVCA